VHSGEYFPRPYGLIRNLREQAELLPASSDQSQKRLRLSASLLHTLVLDPVVSRRSMAAEELIYQQASLLQIAVQDPRIARPQWNEPVMSMVSSLAGISDWEGAYDILDAFYHLNLMDPMVLKNSLVSVIGGIDVNLHHTTQPGDVVNLKGQLRKFFDFDQRVF